MAKSEGVRVDEQGVREGHGSSTQHNLSVKKGKLYQVGTAVDMSESAHSPNKKTGSYSGSGE